QARETGGRCQPTCESASECLGSEWCTGSEGIEGACLPDGDTGEYGDCGDDPFSCAEGTFCGGEDQCIRQCETNQDCAPSDVCQLAQGATSGYCRQTGDNTRGQECASNSQCEAGLFCALAAQSIGVCTEACTGNDACEEDEWCFRTQGYSACLPSGDQTTGGSCADGAEACAPGHICLYGGEEEAFCARVCTGFPDSCGAEETCEFGGYNTNVCLPDGEIEVGQSCQDSPADCQAGSVCIGVSEDSGTCAALCASDPGSCEEDEVCYFFDSGLATCVPEEWAGDGAPL
ncbi:MAG: hypothetical protein KC561_11545, partial [Myxococcales bacterium]|nr:hypothetical protein [Myxococcales bacterium]